MQKSELINELASALSKAQGQFSSAKKDAANPFFKSHYATLAAVLEVVREPLAQNGLAIIQGVNGEEFETTLLHSSGQWITFTEPFKTIKNDPQSIGSLKSYLRRYSILSLLGIATEDDDGESAMDRAQAPQHQPKTKFVPTPAANLKKAAQYNAATDHKFSMGKHKGKTPAEIGIEQAIQYLDETLALAPGSVPESFVKECQEVLGALK